LRAKLAASVASAPSAPEITSGKPSPLSTILPPPHGARAAGATPIDPRRPLPSAHVRPLTSVLGAIPRPEWASQTSPQKPKDDCTIGSAPTGAAPAPAPSILELQGRATTATKPSRDVKPPQVSTSEPRSPSAPPVDAQKATSSEQKGEVKP